MDIILSKIVANFTGFERKKGRMFSKLGDLSGKEPALFTKIGSDY